MSDTAHEEEWKSLSSPAFGIEVSHDGGVTWPDYYAPLVEPPQPLQGETVLYRQVIPRHLAELDAAATKAEVRGHKGAQSKRDQFVGAMARFKRGIDPSEFRGWAWKQD